MHSRSTSAAFLIVLALSLAFTNGALAHEGHAHQESGGMMGGLVEIAGTAAALVIVYVLATWYYRYRDR